MITNLVSHETTHFGNQTVSVEEKQEKVNEGKVHFCAALEFFFITDKLIRMLQWHGRPRT